MNFTEYEKKWVEYWDKNKTFKTDVWDFSKPKYYVLDMFPYPSGQGLHVGHPEGYTASDIVARYKKMRGFNVLHPMGYDSFGLPAEQYAINTGNHPGVFTDRNIEVFTRQLKMLGFSYDWDRMISTSDPSYYKWTQWWFKELYKDGLAKHIETPVNWCEELGTVLANDEVIDGKSERGGFPVVKKYMKQWVINTPQYAERLLEGLDTIDWPQSTKDIQRNWIGKSKGATITFQIADSDKTFDVFTTRCDTLFGLSYCVLAPEHELVKEITTSQQKEAVDEYVKDCAKKSELERTQLNKDKTGVFTGSYAINPVDGRKVPIYISDYVLASYATGAVMAVPAHDDRDFEFAKKYNLPIIPIIEGASEEQCFTGDGKHINSSFINGLNNKEAIEKMIAWLEENGKGRGTITYKLRDWTFARQRYWGEPVPVYHYENGEIGLVDDKDLPLVLPELKDYKGKNGQAPLENAEEWKWIDTPKGRAKRETNTMPGSAASSWYFLRYIDPHNDKAMADPELIKHWMPVDLYLGGSEHAVGHLIYSRFLNNYFYDKGLVPTKEPFQKLCHQGMILGENNEKMSKSRGNVINPDDIVRDYGADTLRMYEMFMGPLQDSKPWNTKNIEGVKRFIDRIWRLYVESGKIKDQENKNLEKIFHQTVKKVTEDIENLAFNTAISQMMVFVNAAMKEDVFPAEYAKDFLKLLCPIVPFITEEIWHNVFNGKDSISKESWPTYDEEKTKDDLVEIAAQINGKIVARLMINPQATTEDALAIIKENDTIKNLIAGKTIVKEIYVPGRIANIIVK